MKTESAHGLASPGRLPEMLTDRFGAFEALAMACIKLRLAAKLARTGRRTRTQHP